MELYEMLCTERPVAWFVAPTVVKRSSGLEIVLYPDVVVTVVGADLEKVVAHVSRDDVSDEEALVLVRYLHGESPPDVPHTESVFSMLRQIKLHLDLCDTLVQCGVVVDADFEENIFLDIARDVRDKAVIQDFWAGRSEGVSVDTVRDALGFQNSLKLLVIPLLDSKSPIARRIRNFEKNRRGVFVPLSEISHAGNTIPPGFVLFEVGDDHEARDDDDDVFPTEIPLETRYLAYGPSLWRRWNYIRRMHAIGSEETETRRIVFPTDFPRKLFVVLMLMIMGVVTPSEAVANLTPRLLKYLNEHAGEYGLVNGCGVAHPEFERLFHELKFFDWQSNKQRLLRMALDDAKEGVQCETPAAAPSSSSLPPFDL